MAHYTSPLATSTLAPRDALCAQAVRVLRITAQQWGMRMEQPRSQAPQRVERKPRAASPCTGLRQLNWAVAA